MPAQFLNMAKRVLRSWAARGREKIKNIRNSGRQCYNIFLQLGYDNEKTKGEILDGRRTEKVRRLSAV